MHRAAIQQTAPSIGHILARREVIPHFQPIVSARQKTIIGLEALARGRASGSELFTGAELFAQAAVEGLTDPLGLLCREQAVRAFAALQGRPEELVLFLNLDVPAHRTPTAIAEDLLSFITAQRLAPGRVAVEILETRFSDMARLRALTALLRERGFLIVLDDVGAGHSNLDRVSFIRPDVLKIDRTLIAGLNIDSHKRSALKSLLDLSRQIGALVVVEGVETEAEATVALELGADLLQGYYLGRPEAHDSMQDASFDRTFSRVGALAQSFRTHMVEKINERRLRHRRFNVIVNQLLCDLSGADVSAFDQILTGAIARHPNVECAYVLDRHGIQVTDTICDPHVTRRDNGVLFRPAPRGADHSLKEYYYVLLDVELHMYTTEPYVSLASGTVSQTISTYFRDALNDNIYVLCVDVHD